MTTDVHHDLELPEGSAAFHYVGHSDRGAVRKVNEDSFLAQFPLFVVADGMGGHAYGDRASQAAVATFASAITADAATTPPLVIDTIRAANEAVLSVGDEGGRHTVSGTTLTGVAFVDIEGVSTPHWMAFNVGDSRIYSWDGRSFTQLSVDHSAVQELVNQGLITALQADRHPDRNIVTRALGAALEVDADVWLVPARGRQTFLLCSDGLTKELSNEEIARIIVFHATESHRPSDGLPITLAERLVNAAVAAGGSDNVTVIVVESVMPGLAETESQDDTADRNAMSALLEETRPRG